jgi:hypothetical protein
MGVRKTELITGRGYPPLLNWSRKMKTKFLAIAIAISCLLGAVLASSITNSKLTNTYQYPAGPVFARMTIGLDEDVNDITITLPNIQGKLLGFVADQTGADTAWSLTIKDEHGVTLFTSAIMDSGADPNRFAFSSYDNEATANWFLGVPIFGTGSVTIADANDASMSDLDIHLYYEDWRR